MEVSSQRHVPAALPPGKEPLGTQSIGEWMGPRAALDAVGKSEISFSCQESNPDHPTRSPSLYRLSYPDSSEHCNLQKIFRPTLYENDGRIKDVRTVRKFLKTRDRFPILLSAGQLTRRRQCELLRNTSSCVIRKNKKIVRVRKL
jgi:hypothetical protein